jgi:hypothetical protein
VQNLTVPNLPFTDDLTKEDFNRLIPKNYDSRIDFMFEILKYFSIDSARKKNHSFRFFVERYHLEDPAGEHAYQ